LIVRQLVLSAPEYSIFTALLEDRVGLTYSLADKVIFEGKLAARMLEAGFESALDYYYLLRYDDPQGVEFEALVQVLVVHETFFFRELSAMRAAVEHFIEPGSSSGRPLRIWCAACSTGEEPLTLAMLLASRGQLENVEIVASDISQRALQRAQAGRFGPRSVRQKMPDWAERYFVPSQDGFTIARELIRKIDWRRINLNDAEEVTSVGVMDLVLCRNVLIYFGDNGARRVVASIAARLRAGGALLVGVSESLMRLGTGLVCEERGGAFVYCKTGEP
jgi:chemotaxis protein methyltransferase CheR